MDTDAKTERDNKRLNNLVAITVVIVAVFMAITKIKDDNINQAMQKAKSESVDAWAEYQASRIKLQSMRTVCRRCGSWRRPARSTKRWPRTRPRNTNPTSRNIPRARPRR